MSPATPFACNMAALLPEQRVRHRQLADQLISELGATRAGDRLFWQLTGNEGVKTFIRMEFAEWFSRPDAI